MTALAVFVGGGLGAVARWALTVWVGRRWPAAPLPWATLGVNVLGCFALGLLVPLFAQRPQSPVLRAALTAGFLGGLTTFSTFGIETLSAYKSAPTLGILNISLNLGLGLGAGAAGLWLGGKLS